MLLYRNLKHLYVFHKKSILGIVFSDVSVTILELSNLHSMPLITAYGQALWPKSAILNGKIQDDTVVLTTINQLLQQLSLKTNIGIISMPDNLITQHTLLLGAKLSAKEQEAWVLHEVKQHILRDNELIYYDYNNQHVKVKENIEVKIVTTRASDVQSRLKICHAAKLKICAVDIATFAFARALLWCSSPINIFDTQIFVHITTTALYFYILNPTQLLFTHIEYFEGNDLLQTKLINYINLNKDYFLATEICAMMTQYWHNALTILNSKYSITESKVIILGNLAAWPEFIDILGRALNVSIQAFIWDIHNIDTNKISTFSEPGQIIHALGLSLHTLADNQCNLLPWRKQQRMHKLYRFSLHFFIGILFAIFSILLLQKIINIKLRNQQLIYQHNLQNNRSLNVKLTNLQQDLVKYKYWQARLKRINLVYTPNQLNIEHALAILNILNSKLPTGVVINRIDYQNKQITWVGTITSNQVMSALLQVLTQIPEVCNLSLPTLNLSKDCIHFSLHFTIC